MVVALVGGLRFSSAFDSGNLESVQRGEDGAWELRTSRDCEGTQFVQRNSTWFHFSVRGAVRVACGVQTGIPGHMQDQLTYYST